MIPWTTWIIVCAVQSEHLSFITVIDKAYFVMQAVMLQIRLYALYKRSNKILGFMVIFFLAEISAHFYISINFDSTTQGWP